MVNSGELPVVNCGNGQGELNNIVLPINELFLKVPLENPSQVGDEYDVNVTFILETSLSPPILPEIKV